MEKQNDLIPDTNEVESTSTENILTEDERNKILTNLRFEQNLPLAIIAGSVAALLCAFLWAVITVATEYQIGYMAIAVGLLVGYVIRLTGKGIDQIFGITGGVLALLGCLIGNFFSNIGFIAHAYELGYFEVFQNLDFSSIIELMKETFSPIDLLFYGIAIYEGYKLSFRKLD
jgi:hypothetical protein